MRKFLTSVLAILITLSFLTACNTGNNDLNNPQTNNGASSDNDESSRISTETGRSLAWPGSLFPNGFPEYPGGVIDIADAQVDGIYVEISGTDRAAYETYKTMLASAGWIFQDYDFGMGADVADKEGMFLVLIMAENETTVGISLYPDGGRNYIDWPSEVFPAGFPVYPNGLFTIFDKEENETSIMLFIERSTNADFNSFVTDLKAAGWNLNPNEGVDVYDDGFEDHYYRANNGEYHVSVRWSSQRAYVSVDEYTFESTFEEGSGWPANLSANIHEYPDGDISYRITIVSGDCLITVLNTSEQTFLLYLSAYGEDGWDIAALDGEHAGTYVLINDNLWLTVKMIDRSTVTISIDGNNAVSDGFTAGWPSNLPVSLPVYPDGEIRHMERFGSVGMVIIIEYTSQESYDAYIDSMLADGWKLDGARDAADNAFTRDSSTITVVLKVHEDNNWIRIDLTY